MMLLPLFGGYNTVVMSPLTFLKNPLLWLTTLTKYRAEITAAPNFAYTRCVSAWRKTPEGKRPEVDLSTLRYAFNAAEPIRPQTLRDFQETFGPLGFGPNVMAPAYGLAEHVVYQSAMWTRGTVIDTNGFVACGEVYNEGNVKMGMEVAIMGDGGECPEGATGEIWLHSPSVAAGYWGRPEKTEEDFGNLHAGKRWLATGDLGYIKEGLLYVTGRKKDVIIVNGRNLYPQDVELSVEGADPEIRPGCTAAFQLNTGLGGDTGREDVVGIAAEVRSAKLPAAKIEAMAQAICERVLADHRLVVGQIAFLKMRTIPKTTSGKIRRSTCKDQMATKSLNVVAGGWWSQSLSGAAQPAQDEGLPDSAGALGAETLPPTEQDTADIALLRANSSKKLLSAGAAPEEQRRAELIDLVASAAGLSLDRLDPSVPLVELGIGSLQAVEIIAAVEEKFGVTLDLGKLFDGATLEELVSEVAQADIASSLDDSQTLPLQLRQKDSMGRPPAPSMLDKVTYPSFNQEQMYILHKLAEESGCQAAYNIPVGLELRGHLDIDRLEHALAFVWQRHAALRLRFVEVDDAPMVQYVAVGSCPLPLRKQTCYGSDSSDLFSQPTIAAAIK